jgi:hypothetical protein
MTKKIFIAVMLIVLIAIASFFGFRQLQVDRCLDDGGRWSSEFRRCEGARTQ